MATRTPLALSPAIFWAQCRVPASFLSAGWSPWNYAVLSRPWPLTFGLVSFGRAAWTTKSSGSDIPGTESSIQAITDFLRLQAPLQKHLNHYLSVLFLGASLEVDEQLRAGTFSRGTELGQITELSFGAMEQMGLIGRLAYADLLREAGRPTLVILDDTLVHSDSDRLEDMKRILFDAASRHQILLFTCHPEKWQDLGRRLWIFRHRRSRVFSCLNEASQDLSVT